jgi:hypothetical protein
MVIKWNKIEANALQRCLDMVIIDGMNIEDALAEFPSYADSIRPELETALWMVNQQPEFSARPGYLASSRKYLMQQIKQAPRKKANSWFRAFQHPVYRLVFTLLMVFTIVLSGTGIASASALPGDNLYAVKLSWENTRLNLTRDMEKEAQLHLRYADKRVEDAISLIDRARYDHLVLAFENYRLHTQGAIEILLVLIDQQKATYLVDDFVKAVSGHIQVLTALQKSAPIQAGDLIGRVLEVVEGDVVVIHQAQESLSPPPDDVESTGDPSETQTVAPTSEETGSSGVNDDSSSGDSGEHVKDGDPDDGNRGGGNDDKAPKEDKDGNPDDGNQGGGNDDKAPKEDKDGDPDDGNQGGGNDDKAPKEDKDGDPDDGNQGGGNDDKAPKEDKDGDPDDGNQGGGNDDKAPKEDKDGNPDDGNQGKGNDDKAPKEDKDGNPDDRNQGKGNDDKAPKEDKDGNPDDGNQGKGNND